VWSCFKIVVGYCFQQLLSSILAASSETKILYTGSETIQLGQTPENFSSAVRYHVISNSMAHNPGRPNPGGASTTGNAETLVVDQKDWPRMKFATRGS
jgi:hypothetical protein